MRRVAVPLLGALLAPVLSFDVAAAAPAAGPDRGPVVIRTARDAAPGGDLAATTYGLDRRSATTPSTVVERPGWTVDVAVPAGTQQVGLVWSGDADAEFTIRTRTTGAWSAATHLAGEASEGPDTAVGRPGAGPLWLGADGVASVRVTLVRGLVSDVQLDAMTFDPRSGPGAGTRAVTAGIARPATPAGGPPIHLRSTWASRGWMYATKDCEAGPKVSKTFSHGIVHHTVGSNSYAPGDVPGLLAGIYYFHTDGRGWCDIGYNYIVDRFGGVWEARLGGLDNIITGGHAQGFNRFSVGVSLLGQFHPGETPAAAVPSAAMMAGLRDVLAWKLGSQGLDAKGRALAVSAGSPRYPKDTVVNLPVINGHRDSGLTACPGEYVYARLPQLRLDVADRIAATNDPTRWRPHVTGARYWTQMVLDAEGPIEPTSRIFTYTSAVVRAGFPQGDLTGGVLLSPTADARIGLVDRLYRTAFGRRADTAGMTTNVGNVDRGTTATDLAENYLISSEFRRRHGTPDDAAFISLLFRNAYGREPSAASKDYWGRRLAAGVPRQNMLVNVADSAEHRDRSGVATKVTVAFFAMLRRVPSAASLAYWEPRLGSGVPPRDLAVGLLRSQEYLARFTT
ncbi:MAG: repeat protein [Acidimicrobiales bacterium]|nr:repeat protein [Acidimicrobiales bacterium]